MSSTTPSTTMITAPSRMLRISAVISTNSRMLTMKPIKMASPPAGGWESCASGGRPWVRRWPPPCKQSLDDGRHQKADDQRHQQRQQRIGDQPVFDQHDVSSITGAGSPPFYRPCSGSGWLHRPPSPHRRGRRSPDSSCPPAGAPSPPGWAAAAPPRTHPPPA